MTALIIGIVIGLIAGLLVYRNNVARAKDIEMKATAEIEAGKAKGKSILDALKGK
jgi:hypothetical protein